jgi:hypothetical protein
MIVGPPGLCSTCMPLRGPAPPASSSPQMDADRDPRISSGRQRAFVRCFPVGAGLLGWAGLARSHDFLSGRTDPVSNEGVFIDSGSR